MDLDALDWVDDMVIWTLFGVAWLLSLVVLGDEALQHIFHPASSKLGSWLAMADISVAASPLELSLAGLVATLVAFVGVAMLLSVFAAGYALLTAVLDL